MSNYAENLPRWAKLQEQIIRLEYEEHFFEQTSYRKRMLGLLKEKAEVAVTEGALSIALDSYKELGDEKKVRETTELLFSRNRDLDMAIALEGYEYLKDRQGILRTAQSGSLDTYFLESALLSYFGDEFTEKVNVKFEDYLKRKGYETAVCFHIGPLANMAYHLAGGYDFCLGIAKGGLFPVYIFDLMGIESRIAECHGHNRIRSSFRWVDEMRREDVEGKRVLVLDKDVVSGKTTERVLRMLKRFHPAYVDIALVHNPVKELGGIGTIAANIPEGYRKIFFPQDFNYAQFERVEERLQKAVEFQ